MWPAHSPPRPWDALSFAHTITAHDDGYDAWNAINIDIDGPIGRGPTPGPSYRARGSRRRRGSESSNGSSTSSTLQEYFSSSSSESGDDDYGTQRSTTSGRATPVDRLPPLSRRIAGVLGLGKTQRKIRRLVCTLFASNSRGSSRPSARSAAKDAAVAIWSLCGNPRHKAEIVRRLTKRTATRARTLEVLLAMADSVADTEVPLRRFCIEARLLEMVVEVPKMGQTVAAYLTDTSIARGAAGIRHLIKTMPSIIQQIPNLDVLLLSYVNRLALNWQGFCGVDVDHHSMWTTLRLLELMLRRHIVCVSQLGPEIFFMLNYGISLFEDKLAPYQVVRSFAAAPPSACRPDRLYLPFYTIVTTSLSLQDHATNDKGHCLAFSALAVLLHKRYCSTNEVGGVMVWIMIDVLLWKTSWQHSVPKRCSRNWDIPEVIPHDDAYAMLSFFSPSIYIPMLRFYFEEAISERSYKILEPLIALIVDHSPPAEPDAFWPTMLRALIQAGLLNYLIRMAVLELPDLRDSLYRVVQGAKRDAVTGILRCFEQMPQTAPGHVVDDVFDTLRWLIEDEAQPMSVQHIARTALDTWNQNMNGIGPQG
ncbi:hypothetical protein FRB94_013889 [Tulasnella sp. JGI-2019a]|nr:hypothetical protein FRB94_013889 [Tulasnella sp. JGI-2019a]